MPSEFIWIVNDISYRFGLLSTQIKTFHKRFDDLADMIQGQHWGSAAFVCRGIADTFTQVDVNLSRLGDSVRGHLDDALWYINNNAFEKAEALTWQSIIEAWMVNDYEARTWTIAIIDKMRQICWDEPYNIIFAARPEDVEI